jgi:hypothetical protein
MQKLLVAKGHHGHLSNTLLAAGSALTSVLLPLPPPHKVQDHGPVDRAKNLLLCVSWSAGL